MNGTRPGTNRDRRAGDVNGVVWSPTMMKRVGAISESEAIDATAR